MPFDKMNKQNQKCYCIECTKMDWIDNGIYRNNVWCKIESDEHRSPRSDLDGSYCKDYRKSKRKRL